MAGLYQLHHQFKDGHTDMVAQQEIETSEQAQAWQRDVADRHPLPKDAQWMMCNERSVHFVKTGDLVPSVGVATPNDPAAPALLPCPFCGSKAESRLHEYGCVISCSHCACRIDARTNGEATRQWNRRDAP